MIVQDVAPPVPDPGHKREESDYCKNFLSLISPSSKYSRIKSFRVTFLFNATNLSLSRKSVSTRADTWITVAMLFSPVVTTSKVIFCYLLIFMSISLYFPLFNYIVNKITNYLYNKLYSILKGRKLILSLTCPLLPNNGRRVSRTFVGG